MANHNGSRHLGDAITSLQIQTFPSWELVLVDDASKDRSVALATRAARDDQRIRVIAQSVNCGPAAARNRAIDAARGRWLAVFDSDDIMRPERLSRLHARAAADGAQIVADNLLLFSDDRRTARPFLRGNAARHPRWIGLAEFVDSNSLYARQPDLGYLKPFLDGDLLHRSGVRYDERLRIGEDYDFLARLLTSGRKLLLEPAPLYLYRRHPASTSYRLRPEHIRALMEAHNRFLAGAYLLGGDELRALGRRERSLRSMLLFDDVISLLKAGRYWRAAGMILTAPQIWPLLMRPLRARVVPRIGRRTPDAQQLAAATGR
jgi:succinoglycan biosynthesis protein ExoO